MGDGAIGRVLDGLEASGGTDFWAARRTRIEHGDLLFADEFVRARALGVVVVQNPTHLALAGVFAQRLTGDVFVRLEPLKTLLAEGIPPERVVFVGNVMVDTLLRLRHRARALRVPDRFGLDGQPFAFVTLHRPSNVDHPGTLSGLLQALQTVAGRMPVIFAVHPRTRCRIEQFGFKKLASSVTMLAPLSYLETIGLAERSARPDATDHRETATPCRAVFASSTLASAGPHREG